MVTNDVERQEVPSEDGSEDRLVPVSEAIRYRKRAQAAEKEAADLATQLKTAQEANAGLQRELSGLRTEQALSAKLTEAGAVDVEAAVLIAKARMDGQDEPDVDAVIEQMRQDKAYLFATSNDSVMPRTAGAKDTQGSRPDTLQQAAKHAAASGRRNDVQQYLRIRRKYV